MNLKEILSFSITQIIIIIFIIVILSKLINIVFKHIYKQKGKTIYLTFINGILQSLAIIIGIIKIGSYSESLTKFSNTILMSSSLLVVVLGFVFQEGLSNIVHGFMLLFFKPFEIGDRIQVNIDGNFISGFVESINLRHTKIINITDNAPQIIPNSKLDITTIKNFSNKDDVNKYPIKVDIIYDDAKNQTKRNLAKKIITDVILAHPLTIDLRTDKTIDPFVKVELMESCVRLTSWIVTSSYEDNFIAYSEITENILDQFNENKIDFAFPHIEISGLNNVEDNQ